MPKKVYSLAYFVSHPIQYQAPLLTLLAQQPDIDLHVYFLTDLSKHSFQDPGFGRTIKWDTPLLKDYKYTFIESKLADAELSLLNPKVSLSSVNQALKSKKWDAVWIHGYNNIALLYIIWQTSKMSIPLLFRGESTLICSPQNLLKNIFIKQLIKRCAGLLWVSSDNKDYYRHYGASEKQLFFTPYAVNNDFFQTQSSTHSKQNIRKDKFVLLFVSKFSTRKNAPLLLDAFNQLDPKIREQSELWFVGDGADKSILENKILEFGLQNQVSLLGFKNQTELPSIIAHCDVFVLPSNNEPFGLIINEAMNLGKPIITTNEVGAARDLVAHEENGWVVQAGSLTALKGALTDAIENKYALREMGNKSLATINRWSYAEDIEGIRMALYSLSPTH